MRDRLVVALGGHALLRPGQAGTIEEQRANLDETLKGLAEPLRAGARLLVTHGNGPQVGNALARSDAGRGRAYEIPLDVAVAQTQGETGYLIAQALRRRLAAEGVDRPVVAVLTEVTVAPLDPASRRPVKPVGPVLTPGREAELRRRGVPVAMDPGRGPRRVVPSPRPLEVVDVGVIARLYRSGAVVIAGGGGGVATSGGAGLEAVVDKDLTAAALAIAVRADLILNVTDVDRVKLDFGGEKERGLDVLTLAEARAHLAAGQFAPGTMGPKVEGAIRFLEANPRGEVIIASTAAALRGNGGTRVLGARRAAEVPA